MLESFEIPANNSGLNKYAYFLPFVRNSSSNRLIDDDKHKYIVPEMMGARKCEAEREVDTNFVKKMRTRYTVEPAACKRVNSLIL